MMSSDARSEAAIGYRRWYRTKRWRTLRAGQLARDPWCWMCRESGHATVATVVDHRRPHRGEPALFFAADNLASLCAVHHSSTKQRTEAGRNVVGLDADGWPRGQSAEG